MSIALVFTIALGVGANASVYGFVRGLIARDTPLTSVERLVAVVARDGQRAVRPLSYDDYLPLRSRSDLFDWLGAVRESQAAMVRDGQSSTRAAASVTPDLARFLNLPVNDGVVISDRVRRDEFAGVAAGEREPIQVDGASSSIGGVAPEWLEGLFVGRDVDLWLPLPEAAPAPAERVSRTLWAIGQLRDGMSIAAAEAALNAGAADRGAIGVVRYTGMTPEVADGLSRVGALLGLASGGVFFIACATVASLLLGRASARSRETSTRVALGAGRGQLAAHLLCDSVLVSTAGAAFGVLLAVWTAGIVPALFFEQDAEQLVFAPDRFGIFSAAAACAGITIVCGLVPLLEVRHDQPAIVLQRESTGPSRAMRRLRTGLVVAQMTCCCVLLISAGLLVQSLRAAVETNAGHKLGQPIMATVTARRGVPPDVGYRYFEAVERAAQSVPGASSAAWASMPPGSRPAWQSLRVEPAGLPLHDVTLETATFTPDLVPQFVFPPVAGRMFGGRDSAHSCRVAIVDEKAAGQLFDGSPVGRSITDAAGRQVVIIGVVAMRKTDDGLRDGPILHYYADQQNTPTDAEARAPFRVPSGSPLATSTLDTNVVSPAYFDAMGLSTTAGRIFPAEPGHPACAVAVVNEEASELYFGGKAVGSAVLDRFGQRTEIIGVVRAPQLQAFQRRPEPAIYLPMTDVYVPRMTLILATQEAGDGLLTDVRRALEAVPGGGTVPAVTTIEAHLSRTSLAPLRIATVLVAAFAATALALGILGLYGTLSDAARQRRRDIAVRIALGARGWGVIRQVVEEGARLAAAGTFVGMLGAVLVARSLTRITPIEAPPAVWAWTGAPIVLLAGVAIASVLPAYRALRVDPLTITRQDN